MAATVDLPAASAPTHTPPGALPNAEPSVRRPTGRPLGSPSLRSNLRTTTREGHRIVRRGRIRRRLPRPAHHAGYLDEQFCQVEDLQDEASPNFVEEVVTLFFKDSARLMSNIEQALEKHPRDFNRWDAYMQQLKGSCSSIGASRMKNECMSFRDNCGQGNVEGCMRSFQNVKREHAVLRQKLESYFQLLRQAGPAGAATRPVM